MAAGEFFFGNPNSFPKLNAGTFIIIIIINNENGFQNHKIKKEIKK